MLGIVRNDNLGSEYGFWLGSLRSLHSSLMEVFSLGFFTLSNFKIKRSIVTWKCSLICLMTKLIAILSFGYLYTNWVVNCWDKRNYWRKNARNH